MNPVSPLWTSTGKEKCRHETPISNLGQEISHVEGKDGIILDELEKGYILKGKIIRPTKVSVGNGQMEK